MKVRFINLFNIINYYHYHNIHQPCTFYSVLDEIHKNDHSNVSTLFLSLFCILLSAVFTHTHIRSHTMLPLSLSSFHTHTEQQRKTPTGLDLFLGMKNQSVFIFSLSIIQFHNLDHNVGNLDGVQIADKASFLVYFLFFQLL